ncbi:hypothetical protein GCM10022408_23920 [Hymenobacter fastidiosus]|uniref:Uncharacterized protein n=1 Tax=Hymenobacter fastidiosus TaxID=486264 RepID=A0ABP7SER0_9BACT
MREASGWADTTMALLVVTPGVARGGAAYTAAGGAALVAAVWADGAAVVQESSAASPGRSRREFMGMG